ncbi:MAG: hypothetical protein JW395_1718 [Nitrospira sp.]|nr:hypothetical protein [Nitrospira sp.]
MDVVRNGLSAWNELHHVEGHVAEVTGVRADDEDLRDARVLELRKKLCLTLESAHRLFRSYALPDHLHGYCS